LLCEKATHLTDFKWRYLKVQKKEFENLNPENFEEFCIAVVH